MTRVRVSLLVCLFVAALVLFPSFALAQGTAGELTGSIQGSVKDPAGALIPGAEVTLSGPALVSGQMQTADSVGEFRFINLPPGVYSLTVKAPGFRTSTTRDILLQVGRRVTLTVQLEVGAVVEVVEVTAAAATIDTTSSKAIINIGLDMKEALPKGRGYIGLLELAPGSRFEPAQGQAQGEGFQLDGASASENTYAIEGMETTHIQTGIIGVNPPQDFFQEVTVKTSGFEAEYGGALGGVVNAVVKSGGAAWHGSGWLYYRNDVFDGGPRYFVRRLPGSPLPPGGRFSEPVEVYDEKKDDRRITEPGFELGGPVWKDHVFLWGAYNPAHDVLGREVDITRVGVLGPRTFTRVQNVHWASAKLDGRITEKVRASFLWSYNYGRTRGTDLPAADGKDGEVNASASVDPGTRRPDRGTTNPNTAWRLSSNWTPTPNIIVAGAFGRWHVSSETRGAPVGIRHIFNQTNCVAAGCSTGGITGVVSGVQVPLAFRGLGGFFDLPSNRQVIHDKFDRWSGDISGAYTFRAAGTHTVKGGFQRNRLSNDILQRDNTAVVILDWGLAFSPSTTSEVALCAPVVAARGSCIGDYGHFTVQDFQVRGAVGSNNTGFFFQDTWNPGYGVTINAGVRFDREFLPSFAEASATVVGTPIEFNFQDKFSPRIGGAWDVMRNGKVKVFASWGRFYDIMKYELPRGSFGGDYWHNCVYLLEDPDWTAVLPGVMAGNFSCNNGTTLTTTTTLPVPAGSFYFVGEEDFRIPANVVDPTCPPATPLCNLIDPALKPVRQTEFIVGGEWAMTRDFLLELRFAHKRLKRTIEDVGILTPAGELFLITNPGEGIAEFPLRGNCAAPGDPLCESVLGISTLPAMPLPKRNYDALEFRFNKRFTGNWFFIASYTWSRLFGNYSGLTNTDEDLAQRFPGDTRGGRHSPNVERAFDQQTMLFDFVNGAPVYGRLQTDRPHTVKLFGGYRLNYLGMSTLVSANQLIYSGTPVSTRINFLPETYNFAWGRGVFADISQDAAGNWVLDSLRENVRTEAFSQTDLNIIHEFKPSKTNEALRVGFELNVLNLFNEGNTITFKERTDRDRFTDILIFEDPTCTPCSSSDGIDWARFFAGFDPIVAVNTPGDTGSGLGMRLDSLYGLPARVQSPRALRWKVFVRF